MKWQIKRFKELDTTELYQLLKLRVDVFVVEQNCPYHEIDNKDIHDQTRHLLGKDDDGNIVSYLRMLPPGLSYEQAGFGRVVVAMNERDKGVSREMIAIALEEMDSIWPGIDIKIGAQVYLKAFYESFGFVPVSNSYLEDGIPHIDMIRNAKS